MPDSNAQPPSTGQLLYDVGWCQGAILPVNVAVQLRPGTAPANYQHAVLITQDCNFVADDAKESHVEFAFGRCPESGENVNGFAKGKNPRLFLTEVGPEQRFLWDVRERQSVSKRDLAILLKDLDPEGRLLDADLREFRAWLGRRYSRPAFPDNFNDRLRDAKSVVDKVIKSEAFGSIRAVFYLISERDEELPEGSPYHLRIIFCFVHNGTPNPTPQTAAEIDKFVNAIVACKDIVLTKHENISDSRFPIQYLDAWECVDFDAHSYGSAESAPPRM